MPQNDGNNTLQRMSLQYGDQIVTLGINPQQYQITFPQRSIATQTQNTIAVQDFGQGLGTITFSGNTGWRSGYDSYAGRSRMDALQSILTNYTKASNAGLRPPNPLTFYNNTDDYSYTVHVNEEGWSIQRDADNPLWFTYAVNLMIIKPAGESDPNDRYSAELGNIYPSVSGVNNTQTNLASGNATTGNTVSKTTAVDPNASQSSAVNAANTSANNLTGK